MNIYQEYSYELRKANVQFSLKIRNKKKINKELQIQSIDMWTNSVYF